MKPEQRYDALTFDCYGTLIDWRAGLLASVQEVARGCGITLDETRLLDDREAEENRLEAGDYLPYREVVARSVGVAAARQGLILSAAQLADIGAGVGAWPAFDDTCQALAVLGTGRALAIVSNVQRRDIDSSVQRLGVPFAQVVTAEDVRSYKPAPGHFEEVLRRLALPKERVLHVAQSLHHDIRPAADLGIDAVWINRRGEATPDDVAGVVQFPDLAGLAAVLGPQT